MSDDALVALSPVHGLYLKPIAKISICVTLPEIKTIGTTISNWEVMERLKGLVSPSGDEFTLLRVTKTTRQLLYFEAETSTLKQARRAVLVLNKKTIKLSGFSELLKIQASEIDLSYPAKKDWESYFRERGVTSYEAGTPGERPDTIRIRGFPMRWLAGAGSGAEAAKKDELDFARKTFEKFGEIRSIDVVDVAAVMATNKQHSGIGNFSSFGGSGDDDVTINCEVIVQYSLYSGFVAAMTRMRGMKLMKKGPGSREVTVNLTVDFDRSGYFSEKNVRKRRFEAKRLEDAKRLEEEKLRRERDEEERRLAAEKAAAEAADAQRRVEKEEKAARRAQRKRERAERRAREAEELRRREEEERERERARAEELKRMAEVRRGEAMRVMEAIVERVRVDVEREMERRAAAERREEERLRREVEEQLRVEAEEREREERLSMEIRLRDRLVRRIRRMEERREEIRRELVRKRVKGTAALTSTVAASSRLLL
ncbi:A-kinase anchor protein 17A-like [Oscarella lobularis]|uniref:A-kinase anchor protein 17A-like n=1 Tax=Oscarella lobularis TaxID=121494 RepID=UPI003313FABB